MSIIAKIHAKRRKKESNNTKIRKKLGMTQAELASILNVSNAFVSMVEAGKRGHNPHAGSLMAKMLLQFHELETGKQSGYRSLETMAFLNEEYRKVLPAMKLLEQDCRQRVKELKKEMEQLKERAIDAEHAIIVFTTAIHSLQENGKTGDKKEKQVEGLNLFKQKAYNNLLTCWEPEQAKLQGKIEAIAGEAKALRRYRVKVMREHDPMKTGNN